MLVFIWNLGDGFVGVEAGGGTMTCMVILVVILASLLFLNLALKPLNLWILGLRVRLSKLLRNRSMLLHSNMLVLISVVFAVFRTAEFSWLA